MTAALIGFQGLILRRDYYITLVIVGRSRRTRRFDSDDSDIASMALRMRLSLTCCRWIPSPRTAGRVSLTASRS